MKTLAAIIIELARFGLLTALLVLASFSAFADTASLDCHEIPIFVLERTEIARSAASAPCAPPCGLPEGGPR